jgi:hypothetical protein
MYSFSRGKCVRCDEKIRRLEEKPRREACGMNRGESDVSRLGRYVAIELDVLAFDPRHRVTAPAADFPTL